MAKKSKKEPSVGKYIAILFMYLVLWWLFLTLFTYAVNLDENSLLYYVVNFLRIAVPLMTLIFGAPIVIIVGYNKKKKEEKKKNRSKTKTKTTTKKTSKE